ncbi:hypothetical protein [Marinicellulosiphila megalodicopiae]|uniref:hypothetical protein n=1 Tax=Marinicellulosiphila megalodicopiae TaxID=2724896 RepID=UPI003BAE41F9
MTFLRSYQLVTLSLLSLSSSFSLANDDWGQWQDEKFSIEMLQSLNESAKEHLDLRKATANQSDTTKAHSSSTPGFNEDLQMPNFQLIEHNRGFELPEFENKRELINLDPTQAPEQPMIEPTE